MDKIVTPDLSHLTSDDYETVYEPAEDSFLMLDALETEMRDLRTTSPTPSLCLEVGSGSGILITALARTLGPDTCLFLSTDINPVAARVTKRTAAQNNVHVQVVHCDLVEPLLSRLQNKVDLILFNPPYVPTVDSELDTHSQPLTLSWAGGPRGRAVMDRLFPVIPQILSPGGRFYLLIVKENDEKDIVRQLADLGLSSSVVAERRAGRERLKVLRFQHRQSYLLEE